ncbi:hypothetical protein [Rhizorhabdus wittichii]
MARPFKKQDAILQPVASWGDRVPHAQIMASAHNLVNHDLDRGSAKAASVSAAVCVRNRPWGEATER